MIASVARRSVVRALVLTGILAVSAVGTALLSAPAAPSLAVFDRPATELELEKQAQFEAEGVLGGPENNLRARLLLEAPPGNREIGQRVWALRIDSSELNFFGSDQLVCLAVEASPGTVGTIQTCMPVVDVERRGFVPLDGPRPYLFVDGDELIIEWGPTGDARLIPRPTPPTPSTDPTEQGADS